MRTLRVVLCAASAAALGAVVSAPASAASETHLTGTFTASIDSSGCLTGTSPSTADVPGVPLQNPTSWAPASGTWRINVGQKTASARFVIYLKGVLHVAYTIPLAVVTHTGTTVVARGDTGAGTLTVTVSGANMTYVIAPYDSTGFMNPAAYCPSGSVTYHGLLDPRD